MNRLERLQAILVQLQSKKVVRAHEIAQRFQVSLRTVYRDIKSLEESGIPIGAEAGIGYFLSDNFSLPPVLFDTREALSLVLTAKFAPQIADVQTNESLQSALFKIKSVLKPFDKEILETVDKQTFVYSGMHQQIPNNSLFLFEIQTAIVNKQVLHIRYLSAGSTDITERDVEPLALLYYATHWHLIAFCRCRNNYRDFRLNRIQKLNLKDQHFEREPKRAYEEFLVSQKKEVDYFEIKITIPTESDLIIAESKYWYGFVNQQTEENEIHIQFINPDLESFARWLLTLNFKFTIESPQTLKDIFYSKIEQLHQRYLA